MAVVTSFTPEQNFWESNPQLLLKAEFKDLYKADKSRNKQESSRAMWWVAFCYDMDPDNKWRGGELVTKQQELGAELMGERDFYSKHSKKLDPLIAAYIALTDSPAKRRLRSLERKMDEKTQTLDGMHYKDDPEGIEKMLMGDEKLYKILAGIQKQMNEEGAEGTGKGGATSSLSDTGEI